MFANHSFAGGNMFQLQEDDSNETNESNGTNESNLTDLVDPQLGPPIQAPSSKNSDYSEEEPCRSLSDMLLATTSSR